MSKKWRVILAVVIGLAVMGGGVLLGAAWRYAAPIGAVVMLFSYPIVFQERVRGE